MLWIRICMSQVFDCVTGCDTFVTHTIMLGIRPDSKGEDVFRRPLCGHVDLFRASTLGAGVVERRSSSIPPLAPSECRRWPKTVLARCQCMADAVLRHDSWGFHMHVLMSHRLLVSTLVSPLCLPSPLRSLTLHLQSSSSTRDNTVAFTELCKCKSARQFVYMPTLTGII